jgi:CRISPR-associated endonuclease/helicase Cas3
MLRKLVKEGSYLVVSTQVVEVGIDISSNIFISEIAPAASLIQRLGRFLRYEDEKNGTILIWFEETENKNDKYKKIYDLDITNLTFKKLEAIKKENRCLNFHSPCSYEKCSGYRDLLDSAYEDWERHYRIDLRNIDNMCYILLNTDNVK